MPDAPAGFNARREGIAHGKSEMIEYDSKTVGTRRRMLVYTPPGYENGTAKYPVFYLLHGAGDRDLDEQRRLEREAQVRRFRAVAAAFG